MDLYFVVRGTSYHQGPGMRYTGDPCNAALYPLPVARKIAEYYHGTPERACDRLEREASLKDNEAVALRIMRAEILVGRMSYVKAADEPVSLWELGDHIKAMRPCPLKDFLLRELAGVERHRREAAAT